MNAKILIVDDDEFSREMIAMILESAGCIVGSAGDGESALKMLSEIPDTDLIISDMNMPGMNGFELTNAIRESGSDVPIIILTGSADARSAGSSGVTEYLLKDENIQDTILMSVERALGKR